MEASFEQAKEKAQQQRQQTTDDVSADDERPRSPPRASQNDQVANIIIRISRCLPLLCSFIFKVVFKCCTGLREINGPRSELKILMGY